MYTPRFEWPTSLRALKRFASAGQQSFWRRETPAYEVCRCATEAPVCAVSGFANPSNSEKDNSIIDASLPASIDQSLIHPALRNLDQKVAQVSHCKEDTFSDTDSAIDVSSCRSSFESQTPLSRTYTKPRKDEDASSIPMSLSDFCDRHRGSSIKKQQQQQPPQKQLEKATSQQATYSQVRETRQKTQKAEADTISLCTFRRRMDIARVVARNKYNHTELRQREFCWADEFYVGPTGHLGIIQEELNASHRKAIKTCPTGYRLRACAWHKVKTQSGKRKLKKTFDGLVPLVKLTDPEGTEWFLEDLRYYPDEEEGDGYEYEYNSDEEVYW